MKAKKFLSIFFALLLAGTMSASVFAGDIDESSGSEQQQVTLTAELSEPAPDYLVTITWESLSFTYQQGEQPSQWNHSQHKYDSEGTVGTWENASSSETASVKITNHSNVAVNAEATYNGTYTNGTPNNGVTVSVSGACLNTETKLDAATPETVTDPGTTETVLTVKVSGEPKDVISSNTLAGTITVTISSVVE